MLLPAWVSIATVRSVRYGICGGVLGFRLTKVADLDDALPPDASEDQHPEGDLGVQVCLLRRKFPESVHPASAVALDT